MNSKLNVTGPGDLGEFTKALAANLDRAVNDPEYVEGLTKERKGNPISLGPRVADATTWADDMATAAKNKSAKWLANSIRPKKDPKERAKKAAKKYENNMRAALDEKRWDKGIDGYDEALRTATIEAVGETGYRSGIDAKGAKITAKIAKLQPFVAALADTLDKMPVDTPEQRAAKMVAARDGMLTIKTKMREAK
jgi:hypothetical protein